MALQLWFQQAAAISESNGRNLIAGAPKVLGLSSHATNGSRPPNTWQPEAVDCRLCGLVAIEMAKAKSESRTRATRVCLF